jgi:hypothetical protein
VGPGLPLFSPPRARRRSTGGAQVPTAASSTSGPRDHPAQGQRRANGVFDVSFDDGRLPLEDIPFFDAGDADKLRELGFNLLRLPVNWSAYEPKRGRYDRSYLDQIQQIVEVCGERGILVLIDWHQDAFSKEIGQDGAPRWVLDRLLGPGGYPYLGSPSRTSTTAGCHLDAPGLHGLLPRRAPHPAGLREGGETGSAALPEEPTCSATELMNEPIAFLTGDPTRCTRS